MKTLLTVMALLCSITTALVAGPIPSMDDFYDKVAIKVPPRGVGQYVFTDNIQSYYEGYTHRFERGNCYYVYSDYVSYVNDEIKNRRFAPMTHIYPYGVRNIYKDKSWDEFVLITKKRGVAVSVHSHKPATLRLFPILYVYRVITKIENRNGVLLLIPKRPKKKASDPQYIALAASRPFRYREISYKKDKSLHDMVRFKGSTTKLLLSSKQAVKDFTVYVAFGFTAAEAEARARRFATQKAHIQQKKTVYDLLTKSCLWTDDMEYNRALTWSKLSAYSMVVEQFGKGIWAGLPWFRNNWGRDTFIALPGTLLVSGQFREAMEVMTNFSTFQDRGTLMVDIKVPDKDTKIKVRDYLMKHVAGSRVYKPNAVYFYPATEYALKQDELKRKLRAMKNAIQGIRFKITMEKGKTYGRIPNLVSSKNSVIYNTTDGTPWFIREIYEYLQYTGDRNFAREIYPVIKLAMEGAFLNYVDKQGFLTHADADTWMDAKIAGKQPWSARGTRANDIQVLWFNALKSAAVLARLNNDKANAARWDKEADKLKENFVKLFWNSTRKVMADRVRKDDSPDYKVRPNQLMLISVPLIEPLLPDRIEALVVKNAVDKLLYSYGIASLSQEHPYFHPYHGLQGKYHKDAAYHNGTVWGWNAGPTVTALTRFGYTDFAYRFAKNLATQILEMGTLGSMSENIDAIPRNGNIRLTGTYSQAWSVSEYARNGYQDFGGFMPELLQNRITLMPAIPQAWKTYQGRFPFAKAGRMSVTFQRKASGGSFRISCTGYNKPLSLHFVYILNDKSRKAVVVPMRPGQKLVIEPDFAQGSCKVNGKVVSAKTVQPSYAKLIGKLKFLNPEIGPHIRAHKEKGFLRKIIMEGKFR